MQSIDIAGQLQTAAEKLGSFVAGSVGALLKNLAKFFVALFMLIFALFFMFRDGKIFVRALLHLLPFDPDIQREMIKESRELIFASVAVALVIAGIQGLLGGLAFALTGIPTPIFWGVVIAFFSVIPVVGSGLIWVPGALWLAFTGHWGKAIVVLAICGGVSTIADNIVRPLLLSNRTRLNDLLLFIGVIGGLEVFGLLGLVVGPTILAAAMGVFTVYMEHREELAASDT
jgi:predicted PurR-regulated permease PerM